MSFILISRQVHLVLGYGLLLAVFAGSVLSLSIPGAVHVSHGDKIVHAAAYAILGLWFAQIYEQHRLRRLFVALFAYGIGIELIQLGLPYRSGSWLDIAANASGLLGAFIVAKFVKNRTGG